MAYYTGHRGDEPEANDPLTHDVFVGFVCWVHVMCAVVGCFEGCLFCGFCVGFVLVGV